MNNTEKVKHIREITLSPINKINDALKRSDGDVEKAIKLLVAEKQVDSNDMANRAANANIVYSYVHNNRIGAMIVLACQTDFVAKNEAFLNLAKNVCMHIVSTPVAPQYIDKSDVPASFLEKFHNDILREPGILKKPPEVQRKISDGKLAKLYNEVCLLNQKFVKDDSKTIRELINEMSSTLGEKIEIKKFTKMTTAEVPFCREDGCH